MNRQWLWLVIVAVAVGGFVVGVVVAQEDDWDIWYLPESYSEPYTPTLLEWKELDFNARSAHEAWLSDRLQRTYCTVSSMDEFMFVEVGTKTQPEWDMYMGDGKFACSDEELRATYAEAAQIELMVISLCFPGIEKEAVTIDFLIDDKSIGHWWDGEMILDTDELPE
ncbi:MAG: hypothetical protein KAW89_02545 [Armatimonadetes bacterium]|nr:hypothetical protein [Armatimonadota bacterium]